MEYDKILAEFTNLDRIPCSRRLLRARGLTEPLRNGDECCRPSAPRGLAMHRQPRAYAAPRLAARAQPHDARIDRIEPQQPFEAFFHLADGAWGRRDARRAR